MNFNALGTEQTFVPEDKRDLSQWIVPPGVTQGPEYTASRARGYMSEVIQAHITEFAGNPLVLVRNSISDDLRDPYLGSFESGELGWFHTSSEAEPRAGGAESKYQTFVDYARSGMTLAYAESWADAWGRHGTKVDDRWCDPPKWNYWRLLFDLHCGVSAIAVYSSDLRVVELGTEGPAYQSQFNLAFEFADRYAGYHASPASAPGAWVAFRENYVVLAENDLSVAARTLTTFTGDYNFLMERLPGPSTGDGLYDVGPEGQRFGAWARELPAGETMRLELDEGFARSLDGGDAFIKVTFIDGGTGEITMEGSGQSLRHDLHDTGEWTTVVLPVSDAAFARDDTDGHIHVRGTIPLILHMVEVTREP
jgi:hypothetical protein